MRLRSGPSWLLLVDAVAVLAFAALGRRSHVDDAAGAEGLVHTLGQTVGVAAPFLVGAMVGVVVARAWRDPLAWRSGLAVWVGAVVVGLALRAAVTGRLPVSFVVVTTIALAVLVLGWRAIVLAVRALRRRRVPA